MKTTIVNSLRWAPWKAPRLQSILESWADTPYRPGQQARGVGVDCARFLAAVLDEWSRIEPLSVAAVPADISLHNRRGAEKAMKQYLRRYPATEVEGRIVQPGDILIMGPRDGGPGHGVIVGPRENTMWHAQGNEHYGFVHYTGLCELEPTMIVHRIFRLNGREGFENGR